jgi:hypothetical protein
MKESDQYPEKLIRAFAIIGVVSTCLAISAVILTIIKYIMS